MNDIEVKIQRLAHSEGLELPAYATLQARVRPRSGLALKHGITCLNSPGAIDADCRGYISHRSMASIAG